jgi:hypothetical protein
MSGDGNECENQVFLFINMIILKEEEQNNII